MQSRDCWSQVPPILVAHRYSAQTCSEMTSKDKSKYSLVKIFGTFFSVYIVLGFLLYDLLMPCKLQSVVGFGLILSLIFILAWLLDCSVNKRLQQGDHISKVKLVGLVLCSTFFINLLILLFSDSCDPYPKEEFKISYL